MLFAIPALAQDGIVRGSVVTEIGNEPVPFANIVLQGTTLGAVANDEGAYEITGVPPGQYNVEASFVGFATRVAFEVQVTTARPAIVNFTLSEDAAQLNEVEVVAANSFYLSEDSPVSLRSVGPTEIKRTPGGNRDISKVVRSLPGVASVPSFRNDVIIRGGAPSENTFYLDGIQIPVINHFQTQGSSGGPVGMINVDLVNEVNFYSGAFPADRGNVMSSILDFSLKDGRSDKWVANAILGATDFGVTVDGPVSKNSSLILSARRSYLKFLFNIFNLPFLPVYNDLQFKYTWKINEKNRLTLIGIGAIDDFTLNEDAPEKADTPEEREEAAYILNILPVSKQWNYTTGLRFDHLRNNGRTSIFLSTNTLKNTSTKYRGNDETSVENLIQDYSSRESEVRLRVEDFHEAGAYRINIGVGAEYADYNVRDFTRYVDQLGESTRDYESDLTMFRWSLFGQVSRSLFEEKLTLSAGARADGNDYNRTMRNMLNQFSPRVSASYLIGNGLRFNANAGIYFQLPPYTALGFREETNGDLVNKERLDYISSKHLVAGLSLDLKHNTRISVEGFYKLYDQYPFSLRDSISLANLGADFGVIGNTPVSSTSAGRSYGTELMVQQKLYKGFYGILAYTWVRSKFEEKNGALVPSSWDNKHLISLTGGKSLKKNWELSMRWLFTGGAPYTPYNIAATVYRENWDVRPYGIPDYDQLNSKRISSFYQLDIRVDKKYYFPKWSLNVYVDIQNIDNHSTALQDYVDVLRDDQGDPVVNPDNPQYYVPKFISNTYGTILPTIGVIVEL